MEDFEYYHLSMGGLRSIHSMAHKSFKHGEGFRIGRFCIIEKDCEVGDNVELMDYVKLMPGTKIGNNCKLDDYVNTSGYCIIGNNVRIKRGTMIGQAVEIEDNVWVGSGVTTTRLKNPLDKNCKEEWIYIKEGAMIGSKALLLAGITIGKGAMIGAGSVIAKDCDINGTYVGNPARRIR